MIQLSVFSGRCDFFNHLNGQGGWFDKDGHPVKMGDEKVSAYYCDEMLDFIAFKERTGGVIHQHKHLKVDRFNQDFIAEKCPQFKIIEHKNKIEDKRKKEGYREKITYTYKYWGKEYTLKEINKRGVYITVDIYFNTLLDLIPYYPYIVSFAGSSEGKEVVYISDKSYVEEEYEKSLQYGREASAVHYYREKLQNHYREVVLRYFNPTNREQIEVLHFDEKHEAHTKYTIDPNFKVQWYWDPTETRKPCWTSPQVVDDHTVQISNLDYDHFLGHDVKVTYVKFEGLPLYLE